jgi:hypothetical protein
MNLDFPDIWMYVSTDLNTPLHTSLYYNALLNVYCNANLGMFVVNIFLSSWHKTPWNTSFWQFFFSVIYYYRIDLNLLMKRRSPLTKTNYKTDKCGKRSRHRFSRAWLNHILMYYLRRISAVFERKLTPNVGSGSTSTLRVATIAAFHVFSIGADTSYHRRYIHSHSHPRTAR